MTLGKVLKAIVVMRSLFIDRTVVRGFNENVYSEDGKVRAELSWAGDASLSVSMVTLACLLHSWTFGPSLSSWFSRR